jgi:hypothetical protein
MFLVLNREGAKNAKKKTPLLFAAFASSRFEK